MQYFLKSFSIIYILIYLAALVTLIAFCSNPIIQMLIYISIALTLIIIDKSLFEKTLILSLFIAIPIMIINPVFNCMGVTTLLRVSGVPFIGYLNITLETLVYTLSLVLKLTNTILVFSLFNLLIQPDKMLNLISLIAARSALIITLTARLVPSMIDELKEIGEIQRTRGVNLDSKNLIQRVRNWFPFTKLILFSSLENSYGISEAIQTKAYGIGKRSVFFSEMIKPRDLLLTANSILIFILLYIGSNIKVMSYNFYPRLDKVDFSLKQIILALIILVLVLFPIMMAWGYSRWQYLRQKI